MSVEVPLRITGFKCDDSTVISQMATNFPDVIISGEGQEVVATLNVDAGDVVNEVLDFVRRIEAALPEVKVQRVDRDFVNTTDIAHRVGVSREAVRKWTMEDTFPERAGRLAASSIDFWEWSEIVMWLEADRNLSMAEHHLTLMQKARLDCQLTEL